MASAEDLSRWQRRYLRAGLFVAGIVPLLFGSLVLLPDPVFEFWVAHQLGGVVTPSPLLTYSKALIGFYLIGYACLCFAVARAPERTPGLVRGIGVFLIARGLQRNYLAEAMAGAFDIPRDAHAGPVIFTLAFGLSLVIATMWPRRL